MKLMGHSSGVVGIACAMALISSVTQADTINVPGDQPTIQAGIDVAVNGDEVESRPRVFWQMIRHGVMRSSLELARLSLDAPLPGCPDG